MFFPFSASAKFLQSSLVLWAAIADLSVLNVNMVAATPARLSSSIPAASSVALAQLPKTFPFKDGTYLYGQSPQAEQIGQEYLVFKVESGNVRGAFYLPRSEYSCFSGELTANRLNLLVRDPYDNTVSPYAIALSPSDPIASNTPNVGTINLDGYHAIQHLSANDHRILNDCLKE
ncbi:MAG: hypothetical protein VKJ02_00915 [Snowella sp.]|nr:hypothetical protein [Snowella sp.]